MKLTAGGWIGGGGGGNENAIDRVFHGTSSSDGSLNLVTTLIVAQSCQYGVSLECLGDHHRTYTREDLVIRARETFDPKQQLSIINCRVTGDLEFQSPP